MYVKPLKWGKFNPEAGGDPPHPPAHFVFCVLRLRAELAISVMLFTDIQWLEHFKQSLWSQNVHGQLKTYVTFWYPIPDFENFGFWIPDFENFGFRIPDFREFRISDPRFSEISDFGSQISKISDFGSQIFGNFGFRIPNFRKFRILDPRRYN